MNLHGLDPLVMYKRAEAAAILRIGDSWLRKNLALVPHHRTGQTRGVYFTAEDIVATRERLPLLLRAYVPAPLPGERQVPSVPELRSGAMPPMAADLASGLAAFAGLRSANGS